MSSPFLPRPTGQSPSHPLPYLLPPPPPPPPSPCAQAAASQLTIKQQAAFQAYMQGGIPGDEMNDD